MQSNKNNPFEAVFRDFVVDFGGEVLEEVADGPTADYLFRNHNIVAELKTLTVDQTENMNRKLSPKVKEWVQRNGRMPPGTAIGGKYVVAIKDMPKEIQDYWLNLLKASVEGLVRDANSQIRDTKGRMKLPCAKGIMIIANQSNLYHDDPVSFRRLLAEILRKRTQGGELRYPHINGATVFSLKDVKSRKESMYFWANLQMRQDPNEDLSCVISFQDELQQAWYRYLESVTGVKVRQHFVRSDG